MPRKVKAYTKKDGTKVRGYAIWTEGRRTPLLVDGSLSRKDAVKRALENQKRGSTKVDKIRRLTEAEQRLADKGKWVRSGRNGEKPGYEGIRGLGPAPKSYRFSFEPYRALNFSTAEKTNPELWEKAKSEAKAKMGGKHSARAMQLATSIYKNKGGGYSGSKKGNSLSKWTKEKWSYSSEKSKGKGRYRPAKIWSNLNQKEKDALNKSKYKGSKEGKQFVSIPKKLRDKVQPGK